MGDMSRCDVSLSMSGRARGLKDMRAGVGVDLVFWIDWDRSVPAYIEGVLGQKRINLILLVQIWVLCS